MIDSPEITVQNVVVSADLEQPLDLTSLVFGLGLERVEYEPEQFPGLVYRLDDPPVVALLFASGNVIITGCTRVSDAERAIETVTGQLHEIGTDNHDDEHLHP